MACWHAEQLMDRRVWVGTFSAVARSRTEIEPSASPPHTRDPPAHATQRKFTPGTSFSHLSVSVPWKPAAVESVRGLGPAVLPATITTTRLQEPMIEVNIGVQTSSQGWLVNMHREDMRRAAVGVLVRSKGQEIGPSRAKRRSAPWMWRTSFPDCSSCLWR